MKKLYSTLALCAFAFASLAQICNPTANLIIFSNYDGGNLNINLNAPMSNIKIGVCTYEGTNISITGMGASSVTAVHYAGYNGNGTTCTGSAISTSITGTPVGCVNTITFAPPVTLSNPNGNPSMVCGTSCSNTTDQGGCNTADQVEAYFLNYFPGSTLFMHTAQYGCWTGTQNVAFGGTCCPLTTGIAQPDIDLIAVYPNPANDKLNVTSVNGFADAKFRIFSLDGKLLNDQARLSETVDISGLDAGIYFIEISEGTKVSRIRFVKA